MLILGRKVGESIMIGDDIEIVILEKNFNRVKLGIKAPSEVKVHRREIWEKIQEQEKSNS